MIKKSDFKYQTYKKRLSKTSLKSEKRIVSGVENLDIMRFIVERFTSFFLKLSFSQPLLLLFNRYLLNHARGITR